MEATVREVIRLKQSVRLTADKFGIPRITLHDHVQKRLRLPRDADGDGLHMMTVHNTKHARAVFTDDQEVQLAKYIVEAADVYFGLTPTDIRSLAYRCTVHFKIAIRPEWHKTMMAGHDWFTSFRQRHNLAIRKPQATSLARATSFNEHTVGIFFTKLGELYEKLKLQPSAIWVTDETGVTTVQQPGLVGLLSPNFCLVIFNIK